MPVFVDRIASTDAGYETGQLSIFPIAKDDREQLYVANNAQTITVQSISYNSNYFIVEDTSSFPSQGLLMIGTEQVYYTIKTIDSFRGLKRGFARSRQDQWPIGTIVRGAVLAEPHNVLKDAVINIETNLGTSVSPAAGSLNGLLKSLETRFLAPRPLFRAYPRIGLGPLTVSFQNFSECPSIRYFWEFGDGATSQEASPTHTYQADGNYDVKLSVITELNAQGIATKSGYIKVGIEYAPAFFYVSSMTGTTSTTFTFVDQTDGEITSRYWVWGDGTSTSVLDPNDHTATHQYSAVGSYNPSLLLIFVDDTKKVIRLEDPIVVS